MGSIQSVFILYRIELCRIVSKLFSTICINIMLHMFAVPQNKTAITYSSTILYYKY